MNWSFRNTALDPNSWQNNRSQTIPQFSTPEFIASAQQGNESLATDRNWTNSHQVTASYGGPIIRNKTFFFALFDIAKVRSRTLGTLLCQPHARAGHLPLLQWTNGNGVSEDRTGSTAARRRAELDGTPRTTLPTGLPSGSTLLVPASGYDGTLQARSVFGPLQSKPALNDCSDAPINKTTLVPNGVNVNGTPGAGGGWDSYRKQMDTTGYINRAMAYYPSANNFEIGDGLNSAGFGMCVPPWSGNLAGAVRPRAIASSTTSRLTTTSRPITKPTSMSAMSLWIRMTFWRHFRIHSAT